VLALLEEVPAVSEARVDWTGTRFLLALEHDAEVDAVVAAADEVIGGDAHRLDRRAEREAVAGYRRGERWMRSGETFALSREEARVLADRHAREAAAHAGLDLRKTDELVRTLEEELAAAFAEIHARGQGLPSDFDAIFARAAERTIERSRSFLDAGERRRLEEYAEEIGTIR
jgi:hypothetical protein